MTTTSPSKERPILFSGLMMQALLDGRKTQTRRIIKGLPSYWSLGKRPLHPSWTEGDFAFYDMADPTGTYPTPFTCPFGRPGDLLWVRETHRFTSHHTFMDVIEYRADGGWMKPTGLDESTGWKFSQACDEQSPIWRPSLHMPRWASRITLRVTDVRVERLQGISEADAKAEGLASWTKDGRLYKWCVGKRHVSGELDFTRAWQDMPTSPVDAFAHLWKSINGEGSWNANPWVWAVSFDVVKKGGEA